MCLSERESWGAMWVYWHSYLDNMSSGRDSLLLCNQAFYFEIIRDSHAVIKNNTEESLVPLT